VLAYELLCGDVPFDSPDGSEVLLLEAVMRGTYSWPAYLPQPREPDSGIHRGSSIGDDDDSESALREPSAEVMETVAGLLRKELPSEEPPSEPLRLGTGPLGSMEVRSSAWLAHFDWPALEGGRLEPPFVPRLACDDDDCNFGPLEYRGEPIVHSTQHDGWAWEALFNNWSQERALYAIDRM